MSLFRSSLTYSARLTSRSRYIYATRRQLSSPASRASSGLYGVARALGTDLTTASSSDPTLFTKEFSLSDRVALVSGANRGLGLEAALGLVEAGARSVYCLDIAKQPGEEWSKAQELVARMGMGSLEYINADVRDQEAIWKLGETIAEREGRLDVCVAAAGILGENGPCLEFTSENFQAVIDVDLKGVLFTAQAAGRQMARLGNGGSIILFSSVAGSVAFEPEVCNVSYHSSKAGVLQLARSMACELGPQGIRVNTVSPGPFKTKMENELPDEAVLAQMGQGNPLGRVASPYEIRGVIAWLASDASSFCTGSNMLVSGGHQAW